MLKPFYADLHIHSCLSPCADDDMTPANICGMAKIKGLNIIAVTDHNTARNLPYVKKMADVYGLTLIPGMEITTSEEVHILGYFPSIEIALDFSEMLWPCLPKKKNRPEYFGNQLVVDENDNIIAKEDSLLIGANNLPLGEVVKRIEAVGGLACPAHINRGANGLLINLGMMPADIKFRAVEIATHLPCTYTPPQGTHVFHSSDAHQLGNIFEATETILLEENTVFSFFNQTNACKEEENMV